VEHRRAIGQGPWVTLGLNPRTVSAKRALRSLMDLGDATMSKEEPQWLQFPAV
jgi:hypothetical protein